MGAPVDSAWFERRLARERAARKHAEELLETKSRELYAAKQKLEAAYADTVEVFANLVGGKGGRSSESMRAMGRQAMALGKQLGLDSERTQTVCLAALLCDLGKLALPDELVATPYVLLNVKQQKKFQLHPQLACESLMALAPLEAVANAILGHCEFANGRGYPNGHSAEDTLIESKIVGIIKDFDGLQRDIILDGELTESEAMEYLQAHSGERYDSAVVSAFVDLLASRTDDSVSHDE